MWSHSSCRGGCIQDRSHHYEILGCAFWSSHSAAFGSRCKCREPGYRCLWNLLSIRKPRTTPHHSEGNGQVEHKYSTLISPLNSFVDSQNLGCCDKAQSRSLMAYRGSVHTSATQTLLYLTCGCKLQLPTELCLSGMGTVTVTARDFAVTIGKTIVSAQDHAQIQLGTSRPHPKSNSTYRFMGNLWGRGLCLVQNECPNSRQTPQNHTLVGQTIHDYWGIIIDVLYATHEWLASVWEICGLLQ